MVVYSIYFTTKKLAIVLVESNVQTTAHLRIGNWKNVSIDEIERKGLLGPLVCTSFETGFEFHQMFISLTVCTVMKMPVWIAG